MVNKIMAAARHDKAYCELLRKLCVAEKQLDDAEEAMTDWQRDVLWNFFERTEAVNQRLLEITVELCFENR